MKKERKENEYKIEYVRFVNFGLKVKLAYKKEKNKRGKYYKTG